MKNAFDSIDISSDNNPYQPPSVDDAPPFALRTLLRWWIARSVEGQICFTLAMTILLGWTAAFQIQRFILVSYLLLASGIMTAVVSIIVRNWSGVVLGLSATGLCLFCYFVIYYVTVGQPLLMQGAHHADELLRPIVLLYGCVAVPVGVAAILRHARRTTTPDATCAETE